MARHDPDATRNVSVVPELPENKKRTAEEVTHSACTGWSRTARLAGGAPSLTAFVQRASLAALQLSVVTLPNLHRAAGSTGRPSLPTGGRVSPPYKHNVGVVKNAFCLLQRQQRPKSVVNFFFWASRRHVRWPGVHYGILATASPSIGGDTAAILLTGLSANLWKSELQTVKSDTGAAQKTLCIATKKKRNEHLRETAPSTCWAARVLAQTTPPRCRM